MWSITDSDRSSIWVKVKLGVIQAIQKKSMLLKPWFFQVLTFRAIQQFPRFLTWFSTSFQGDKPHPNFYPNQSHLWRSLCGWRRSTGYCHAPCWPSPHGVDSSNRTFREMCDVRTWSDYCCYGDAAGGRPVSSHTAAGESLRTQQNRFSSKGKKR